MACCGSQAAPPPAHAACHSPPCPHETFPISERDHLSSSCGLRRARVAAGVGAEQVGEGAAVDVRCLGLGFRIVDEKVGQARQHTRGFIRPAWPSPVALAVVLRPERKNSLFEPWIQSNESHRGFIFETGIL